MPRPSLILVIVLLALVSFTPMAATQDMNQMSLHTAAARDDVAMIKTLLSKGTLLISTRN